MKRVKSLGILLTTAAVISALQFGYAAVGTAPPEHVARLASFAFALAFVLWMVVDAQVRRQTPCFDFGLLVAVFFPISLVWYVFWSRGARGFLLLAALLSMMLLPWLSAAAAWLLRYRLT
jgi:hypothetical protein